MNGRIDNITLKGFKTIGDLTEFRPKPINLFIGPNGAGKSNFISFFRLLSWMMRGDLQQHVGSQGGASALLHKGAEVTRTVEAKLSLRTDRGENEYEFWLGHAAGDTFIFNNERYRFSAAEYPGKADWAELDAGHREAGIVTRAEQGETTARVIQRLIRNCIVYQFHNTSENARIRQKWSADDNTLLKEDGANLAPFLLRLQEEYPLYYHRIVEHLRLVLPFFKDFEITRDRFGFAILRWSERHNDMVFSASQAADGMIRCMAMIALLGQPEERLPDALFLDEPELGLHPFAVSVVAGLMKSVSRKTQIFTATQSTALLDYFDAEDIVIVERREGASRFRRCDPGTLSDWLDEYSLSELWEKNVLGGRP